MALPLGRAWRAWRKPPPPAKTFDLPETTLADHVIVAGYGRSGRAAARALKSAGIPLVVVELNHALMPAVTSGGFTGIWGDVTREEILRAAMVEQARMLLLTTPDQNVVRLTIARARRLNPALILIARAVEERHISELRKLGVFAAVQPEFEGGAEMVRQALILSGLDEAAALHIVDRLRSEFYG
jgi:CPA2 family monovalent cation:H+ antiporter-2